MGFCETVGLILKSVGGSVRSGVAYGGTVGGWLGPSVLSVGFNICVHALRL